MRRQVSVRGVVVHEGKLLCVQLQRYADAINLGKLFWCLPGGGLESGEPVIDGVRREMIEETGVKPDIGRLLYIQQFAHDGVDYLEFFFHIKNSKDYLDIDLSKTTHGTAEIATIGFVDPTKTYVLPEFLSTEPLAEFISKERPVKLLARY